MWYPTLPDLLHVHDRVCAVQEVEAWVNDMSTVDESILAPQRAASEEDRTSEGIALKCTMMLIPLVCRRPFENCNDRVAYSVAQRSPLENEPVFVDADGNPPKPDRVSKRFKFYVRKAKLSDREELSFHSSRHTTGSWLSMQGVPLRVISEILGHSKVPS